MEGDSTHRKEIKALEEQCAALPEMQPEWARITGAVWNVAIRACMQILLDSPTYQQHIQLCFCQMCSYVRGNVTEMQVLLKRGYNATVSRARETGSDQG